MVLVTLGGASHWFKKFLDSNVDIYNQKYTLYDNPFLPKVFIENLEKEYEGTVYYDRYILGKWKSAEGIIYREFADNSEKYLIDKIEDRIMFISIGIDYGAGQSKTKFVATGISYNFQNVYILDEVDLQNVYSPEQLYEYFVQFYEKIVSKYDKCNFAFCDYGALGNVLTLGLINYCRKKHLEISIQDCSKGKIKDRILLTSALFSQNRLKILRKNTVIIKALQEALWNSQVEDERLDDGTTDIDSLDAFEYSINSFYEKLIRSRVR